MQTSHFALIADMVEDADSGWSIGSFGAVGEFVRDAGEPADIRRTADRIEVVTARGGMRVVDMPLSAIAWDSLSGDGETWGHALAFCLPRPVGENGGIRALGPDGDALRAQDRGQRLYDMGVACGCVTMAIRTGDEALIARLDEAAGGSILSASAVMPEMMRAQPARILLSPAGRIEVYQPIPPADGKSPEGPHTHLLPRLIAKGRAHSANVPIPDGWQSALSMHPRSPWRDMRGERHPFDPARDDAFCPLLDRFGLPSDREVERDVMAGLDGDVMLWPADRRGRHKARITLRRLHAAGDDRVRPWRALHDRAPTDTEEGEEA